ncbi:MAG: UDP-N-acetylmuramoyl-L-alanyl-D-glutamate--2,6-diaminopimelate ligase [Pseudomonadales bacterium]|nr:UDP-N-acetylmuramoyl-L-alanyl-D-glutamate--2,6-diaminopimelate ligase [Pseudomonadales bacterium]
MRTEYARERSLGQIVPFIKLQPEWQALKVTGLAVDSRQVRAGDCFLAYPGHHADGRDYLRAAFAAGAACALVEAAGFEPPTDLNPLVPVAGLKTQLGVIADNFYDHPSAALGLLAVTGTNGKTSVSQLAAQALTALGQRCGVIGTLGNGLLEALEPAVNTTPDVVACNRLLAAMRNQGAAFVTMETSSHGLEQGRVNGLCIRAAVFTNISRDHLDYHGSMAAYTAAKARLARHPGLRHLILNADDERVMAMAGCASPETRLWTFSLRPEVDATLRLMAADYHQHGMRSRVAYGQQQAEIRSPLIGEFNSANLLATLALLLAVEVPLDQAADALSRCQPVPGRMQRIVAKAGGPVVVVDFAHTPAALEHALVAVRRHTPGRLWCVFGCGGDRDRGKRPLMAATVARLADELVLTADNPRSEKVGAILADMSKGIPVQVAFQSIEDRTQAIHYAIRNAAADDLILIAGKGDETYQEVAGVRHPYSDSAVAQAALQNLREVH